MLKSPLFRKVNTLARGVRHGFGGDFREERNTKASRASEATRSSMGGKVRRGLDYTPLFKFLLSKVGEPWSAVEAEALSRLDRPDPVYWLVARHAEDEEPYVRIGESSYYSGLRVDEDGKLQRVDAELGPHSLAPWCSCCTHTFNGVRFTRPFASAEPAP